MPIWPADVPIPRLASGWGEQRNPHFSDFVTDSGFSLRSKLPGTSQTVVRGTTRRLTREQSDSLRAFYKTACAEGALSFEMEDPDSGSLETFTWAEPPAFSCPAP